MPALVAIRFDREIREQYQRLLEAGKAKRVAITAVMRGIVVRANTLLREDRDRLPERPDQDGYAAFFWNVSLLQHARRIALQPTDLNILAVSPVAAFANLRYQA